MTEDEAKTKWCPFVRVALVTRPATGPSERIVAPNSTSFNASVIGGTDEVKHTGNCITTDCMAWRVTDKQGGPAYPGDGAPEYKTAGYCGLAGQPS